MKNMNKYDKMLEFNKKASEEKVATAKETIFKMLEDGEKVTVPKLVQKTGLSRGFFYKNLLVRREVDRAMQQQAGMVDPKRYIGDMAMRNRVELLQQQVEELKRENETLRKEKKRLEKALNKRELNILKNL